MRILKISEEVWQAIAERGKFGETEDDVLRRIFGISPSTGNVSGPSGQEGLSPDRAAFRRRRSFASQRMSAYINRKQFHLEFQDGAASSWMLPDPKDKAAIRAMLDKALRFAREHGASLGQLNAVRKTLTDEGYHLTK